MDEEFDFNTFNNQRKKIESLSAEKYWNEYNGDWKRYLDDVFKWDKSIPEYKEPLKVNDDTSHNPFSRWI